MQALEFPQLALSTTCERGGVKRDDKILLALEIGGADRLSKPRRKRQVRQLLSDFRHGHSLFTLLFAAALSPMPHRHRIALTRFLSAQDASSLPGFVAIPHAARNGIARDRTKCAAVLAVTTIVAKKNELILAGHPFDAIAGIRS